MKNRTTRTGKKHQRKFRILALFALLLTVGVVAWQASQTMKASSLAAAFESSRNTLDAAVENFKANETAENWQAVEIARQAYETAFNTAVAANAINPNPVLASSAALQQQTLAAIKRGLSTSQKKIGSRLFINVLKSRNQLPQQLSSLRAKVQTTADGLAIVDVTAKNRTAGLKVIDRYGFRVRSAVGNMIRAEVPFSQLEALAGNAEIIAVREAQKAMTHRTEGPAPAPMSKEQITAVKLAAFRNRLKSAMANMVVNVSEGDKTHRAEAARSAFGVNGTGVKIGVLSDGVDSLATAVASGDLSPVTVLPGQAGSGDEGTAMLEIVHDLAPGAQLYFATAFTSITSFAQNIRDLRTAGCDIIVDDIIYFAEPAFQDGQAPSVITPGNGGVVIQAVKDVTAAGALYFSSAGNEGNKDDNTSGVWEGNFNATAAADPAPLAGANLHNFGDGGNSNLISDSGAQIALLQWANPLGSASYDYDLYDMDGALTTIFDASTDVQDGTGNDDDPIEGISPVFSGERLLVDQFATGVNPGPVALRLQVFRGILGINTPGATFGHSSAALAFSVAATPAAGAFAPGEPTGPFPNPHSATNVSETFTADGPRRIILDENGAPLTAGNFSITGGVSRQKPDITAADGVATSAPGFNPFFGTSAAAPHAAAIAALVKSAVPSLTAAQIRTALISSAIDIEAPGVDRNTGAGIVMAYQALQAVGAQPVANLALGATTVTEAAGDNDGFPEPCERLNYTFRLDNIGAANATAVSAALTSSTPGVVITPASAAYPNINAGANATNATPFNVVLPCTLACGTTVNFTLTVTYTGGPSPKVFNFSVILGAPGAPVTVSYSGAVVPIPDGADLSGTAPGAPVSAIVNVAGVGPLYDVDLKIDGTACNTTAGSTTVGIDHTFVNDLEIKLTSPSATTVLAIDNTDGGANNFCQTRLDDDTANPSIQTVVSTDAPFTNTFKPANPLSAFDGQNANGNWTLTVQDFFSQDTGNIRAFSLILTPVVCSTAPCAVVCPANITTPATGVSTVVTYAAPTVTGGCGVVTCTPASGSGFAVGTTTVTCSPQSGSACTFTVTVVNPFTPAPTASLFDPLACSGPGNKVNGSFGVPNTTANPQTGTVTTALPPQIVGVPNTCVANFGSCTVSAGSVNWSGTIPANQTLAVSYMAQVADVAVNGTYCATTTAVFNAVTGSVQACLTVNCPPVGPGGIFPAASEASDQAAGSVLIYNIYTSGATSGNTQNTRINITNTNLLLPAFVHLFFVAESCSVADSYLCLTGNQTASFLASDLDPGTTGYLVAVAVDGVQGCPTNFNYLIGDEYVKFSTGHAANLGAEAISALAGGLPPCDGNSNTATINFDGISYNRISHALALDNIGSRADGNDTLLILNRIGGNLGTGAGVLSTVFGIFYDDAETAVSFTFNGGHQFRGSLSNNFPRITPRFETYVPAGRTGWFKVWPTTPTLWGMTGAAINFNPNAASSAGAFNQGHNLHKLTLTNTANYIIPVFPPSC